MSNQGGKEEKDSLERVLQASFNSILVKYLRSVQDSIQSGTGLPSSSTNVGSLISRALDSHYVKTQGIFSSEKLSGLGIIGEDDISQDMFDKYLRNWVASQVPLKTNILNDTNDLQAEASKAEAFDALLADQGVFSNRELALATAAVLSRKLAVRRDTIAATETQVASESTKFLKAKAATTSPILISRYLVIKTWNSILDGRERQTHNAADGQERPTNQAFSIGGASLLYPGDPAGPVKEIVNCRCFLSSITKQL